MKNLNVEIERKFKVKDKSFIKEAIRDTRITQGYLSKAAEMTVRVRKTAKKCTLTVKGKSTEDGLSRDEFEMDISQDNAATMLSMIPKQYILDKTRYIVDYNGSEFEVDVFHGRHEGLIIAEIELKSKDQKFSKPSWLGEEVTGDVRYYNSSLAESSVLQKFK